MHGGCFLNLYLFIYLQILIVGKLHWYERNKTLGAMLLLKINQCYMTIASHLPIIDYFPLTVRPIMFYSFHKILTLLVQRVLEISLWALNVWIIKLRNNETFSRLWFAALWKCLLLKVIYKQSGLICFSIFIIRSCLYFFGIKVLFYSWHPINKGGLQNA